MIIVLRIVCVCLLLSACSHTGKSVPSKEEFDKLINASSTQYVEELSREIAVFENVAFGLGLPLRKYLNDHQIANGKMILDLGAGSGVLSLIALKNGATKAVATDINRFAVANAIYNAEKFGFIDRMEVRQVSMDQPGAYSVIQSDEKFDLIVSNPPQGRDQPKNIYEYSHSDPRLAFFRSILEGLGQYLTEDGKGVFALYYHTLMVAQGMANELGLVVTVLLKTENRNGLYYLVEIKRRKI